MGDGNVVHMSPITIVDVAPRDGLQSDGAVEWMQTDALLGRTTPGLLSRAGLFPAAG